MATSGVIQSKSCASTLSYYGMKWEFRWTAEPDTEPGVTVVSWELYTVGRTTSPTQANTEIAMTIVDQNGNELLDYKSTREARSFKGVLQDSGSFKVSHNTDGTASFKVSMTTDIYEGYFRDASGTGTLDKNMPYYYVYIDTGAEQLKAIPCIDTGSDWKMSTACIDNGTSWDECT